MACFNANLKNIGVNAFFMVEITFEVYCASVGHLIYRFFCTFLKINLNYFTKKHVGFKLFILCNSLRHQAETWSVNTFMLHLQSFILMFIFVMCVY
jgi:hypothetical protein